MIKHVVIPTGGLALEADWLVDVAAFLGSFNCHLEVLHIRPEPNVDPYYYGMGVSADTMKELIREAERGIEEEAATSRRTFHRAIATTALPIALRGGADRGMSAAWREERGPAARVAATAARFADLSVLPRPPHAPIQRDILEAVLFDSGRPVLMTGGGMEMTRSVAVAWDGGVSAARAVAGAMDFLTRAASVTILAVEDGSLEAVIGSAGGPARSHPNQLAEHLAWHGVQAIVDVVQCDGRSVGEALTTAAMERKAGLLVMGAFGHSRVREMILGGATRHLLSHPLGCPVLMTH